jgi:hypothetical protein
VSELNEMEALVTSGEKADIPKGKLLSDFRGLLSKEAYEAMVEKGKYYIHEGDIFQVVLSNRFEANAFENGLYSYLMSCNLQFIGEEEDAMQESIFYKRLIILKKANKAIKEFPNDAKRIAETTYGKTYEWIKKLSDSALKNCRRQIGRALIKFRNDYDWSHGGNSTITI